MQSPYKQKIVIANDALQLVYKRLALATFLIPLLGTIAAVVSIWWLGIGWLEARLLLSMYALTTLGIEIGFHRYFSHRAFQTSTPVRAILAVLGSMAAQGGVIYWVAHHRRHHQYTDEPGDPHSPYLRGFWHAHIGWLFEGQITNTMLFAKDLLRDPVIGKINQLHHVWVLLGLAIPTIVGGIVTHTWIGALQGLLWGGFVRLCLAQQIISSTNSICHMYGDRPFELKDRSTNNIWLAFLSCGQSWHNNHHAFPNSAVAGLQWWQIDPSTWVIRLLEVFGLVWDVNCPTKEKLQKRTT
ncbi:acyl-CoA desaturase [Chroococcidiopsis sp. TS-821]|uniref:acyl-CoA desaturase n=1 Tax=Chroococcidiopsis sp. TS-821 TaxID=1378066 RepID=UPI000CEF3288|nr:acyl-CoA desaturase [Chroococcidiopsis sp. TS-821]PPS43903.1 acyl-CoA desaturase [Chroococcidiopsis sp. TS-821]